MSETERLNGGDAKQVILSVSGACKSFGDLAAVDGMDLEIESREIVALLGPSGCGKTTMLRLIAGLERLDAGEIRVGGTVLSGDGIHVRPDRRRIGMVFQDYALFPHLDVAGNVGYALGRKPDRTRVMEVLEMVGLAAQADRDVHELSGGQQQRVALARALAAAPELVLLDEPFSNLDAALRQRLREEVREIIKAAGATALFVTHDQEEALSLADRVALIRDGQVEQLGTPQGIYGRPATRWAAEFLGEVEVLAGQARSGEVLCELGIVRSGESLDGGVDVLIRPESLAVGLRPPPGRDRAVNGTVVARSFFGHDQLLEVELSSGRRLRSRRLGYQSWHPGDRVYVWLEGPVDVMPGSGHR